MYRRSRDYTICALFISQSLITRSQFIYGYRKGEGVLRADNTKHRQILRNVSMPRCQLYTFRYTETLFRSSHTFFSPHNKGFCFSMNNTVLVALFGHIAYMEHHIYQLQKLYRACGKHLVARKRREFMRGGL